MNRRAFVMSVSGLLAAPPIRCATPLPRVVWFSPLNPAETQPRIQAFMAGMHEAGQADGRTFRLEIVYAHGDLDRSAALIREAVATTPAVLVVTGLLSAKRAHDATKTIPIVVATSSDLADAGVVKTLARPGGNVTGVSDNADETAVKRLELLREALPKATRVGLINNPDFPATAKIERTVQTAAKRAGISLTILHARDRAALTILEGLGPRSVDAILVGGDALFVVHARALIERATALNIPVVHYWPTTADDGAMVVYAADVHENFRRSASYVDRILKGANPGDLPIYQPTRYELVVNLKAARALGVAIPRGFVVRADRVIE